MSRSVPIFKTGLRAVALAAVLGGQTACVRPASVLPVSTNASLLNAGTLASSAAISAAEGPAEAARHVVVRDYWGSPRANVLAWSNGDDQQGLRAAVLRDGTVAYDHVVYFSVYSVPNLGAFQGAHWYAFSDAEVGGRELPFAGVLADQFNCQGKKGCTPYLTFRARVPDALLRNSRDSLIVKVVSFDGANETMIALRGDLISSYLATVDSVSAARKARTRASNH